MWVCMCGCVDVCVGVCECGVCGCVWCVWGVGEGCVGVYVLVHFCAQLLCS